MKSIASYFLAALFLSPAFGQVKFEPTILVLYPNEIVMSELIAKEIQPYIQEVEITEEVRKTFIKDGLPPNWKMIRERELSFIQKQDFATLLTLTLSREFIYKEVQHHDNLVIFPVKETCGADRPTYKVLTDKYNVSWLVNILKVELYYTESKKNMKVAVQLFNTSATWLFLDTIYITDDTVSPESCEAGTWLCLAENIKARIAKEITDKVDKNRHLYH